MPLTVALPAGVRRYAQKRVHGAALGASYHRRSRPSAWYHPSAGPWTWPPPTPSSQPRRPQSPVARAWPRAGIQAWAAAHPSTDPVFTGPKVPPVPHWPPQVRQVMTFAAKESSELNHPWDDLDHLVLGMLHADCPGAARAVLDQLVALREPLRQALVDSLGDPFESKATGAELPPGTQIVLERANLEAAQLGRRRGLQRARAAGADRPVGPGHRHRLAGPLRDHGGGGATGGWPM